MFAEFKHTLGRKRGAILGWGIGLALYGVLMVSLFDSIADIPEMQELLKSYPKEFMAFLGGSDFLAITTPRGYMDLYYFTYMPVIVGIFAAVAGAGLLVNDEEKGILDLVLAYPISRTALFWGRVLGFVATTVLILLVSWLSWVLPAQGTTMNLAWHQFLRPFIPLFAELMLWGTLALLLSMVLPSARMAGAITSGLLVADYLLQGLANINENLKTIVRYTPLHFYEGGKAMDSLNGGWLALLLGASLLLALLARWRFQRRDIRVGGEGGWRLPAWSLRRKTRIEGEAEPQLQG
jgi:ABC-2 type transport system permease protein